MVVHFKVNPGPAPIHEITRENVESLLGRRLPWFQQGQQRGDDRHFAVCPYCDNPVQLKGLYRRQETSPRPYGSHTGKEIAGFFFDLLDLEFCPYRLKRKTHRKEERRKMGPAAKQLIKTAIDEFDRIVMVLRDDFGFSFSNPFAERMLEQWFDSKGYLYTGAHLRNLPWMIAYFMKAENLFGQAVAENIELTEQIKTKVSQAKISDLGKLEKGTGWYRLDLQCLHHRVDVSQENGVLLENMTLRIQDFTKSNEPSKAPTIYEKKIVFNPERFEALIQYRSERAKRNKPLLEIAQNIAKKWKFL